MGRPGGCESVDEAVGGKAGGGESGGGGGDDGVTYILCLASDS